MWRHVRQLLGAARRPQGTAQVRQAMDAVQRLQAWYDDANDLPVEAFLGEERRRQAADQNGAIGAEFLLEFGEPFASHG